MIISVPNENLLLLFNVYTVCCALPSLLTHLVCLELYFREWRHFIPHDVTGAVSTSGNTVNDIKYLRSTTALSAEYIKGTFEIEIKSHIYEQVKDCYFPWSWSHGGMKWTLIVPFGEKWICRRFRCSSALSLFLLVFKSGYCRRCCKGSYSQKHDQDVRENWPNKMLLTRISILQGEIGGV